VRRLSAFCTTLVVGCASALVCAAPASAQSTAFMLNECSSTGQTYFRDFNARTDMRYNGQRSDGTHAINGRIFLETRFADFACSYDRSGRRMVEFFAEGRMQNAFLPGGAPTGGGSVVQVTGLRGDDTLNVRRGPGTRFRVVGVLSNGTSVLNLGCRMVGRAQWCQIEMMTDMRERGWVNGRYLTRAGATPPPAAGAPIVQVQGLRGTDTLNVRGGPGIHYRVVGVLSNGASVRNLRCQTEGSARWCQIEMLTDMRERGWVNARFLSDAGGAAAPMPDASRTKRVRFAPGMAGTEFPDLLAPGTSVTYLLGARDGQNLTVQLVGAGAGLAYRIFNPDGTALLTEIGAGRVYRGQLWQSGDHRIEVINRTSSRQSFDVLISVR